MTTITIDDDLIHEIITVSHYSNAQEAVNKILAEYIQRHKPQTTIMDLLAMPEVADVDFPAHYQTVLPLFEQLRLNDEYADDELALLFERDKDTGRDVAL